VVREWWQARADRQLDRVMDRRWREYERDQRLEIRYRWWAACNRPELRLSTKGATPGDRITSAAAAPLLAEIQLGRYGAPTVLIVELRPGQMVDALEAVGRELAAALCVARLRFETTPGSPYVRVTLVERDPLTTAAAVDTAVGTVTLGTDEYATPVRFAPERFHHLAIQGQTGAGKSTALYHLLRQIMALPNVQLSGVDPSGLLFRELPEDSLRVSGLSDLEAVDKALSGLVAEMDARARLIPRLADALPCGPGAWPWLFVVLEEFPALLAAVELADRKLSSRVKLHVGRLTAEGRKVGLRCVIAAQRFEATSVGGAVVRANCPLRMSLRVDDATSVGFLHEQADPQVIAEHVRAESGVALLSAPGTRLRRLRVPHVTYAEWAAA
jgi:S-DNA-T family DNA segregation ATPase FtsK/SpoIIIE